MGQKFIDLNVRLDFADKKGRTPFLNYYERSAFEICDKLVHKGANVNQIDASGLFALKYALIKRNDA